MLADERSKDGHVKKRFTRAMQDYVEDKLKRYQWSPEQIVGRAKPEGVEMVSHERIYQFIWQDKADGGELYKHWRTGQKKYKKRYGSKSSRGQIPDKISIEQRPDIVDKKEREGDFESDLIIGKNHKGAVDNGKEFAAHKAIAEKLDCKVYFAHPYASWERGLNEYTNKLIRQYFPKNQSLENIPNHKIIHVTNLLNNRPRKKLGFKTPNEVFYQYIYRNSNLALAG